MAPLERLKILMQVQGNAKVYTGVWQVRAVLKAGLPFCLWHPIVLHVTPWPPRAWRMAARTLLCTLAAGTAAGAPDTHCMNAVKPSALALRSFQRGTEPLQQLHVQELLARCAC